MTQPQNPLCTARPRPALRKIPLASASGAKPVPAPSSPSSVQEPSVLPTVAPESLESGRGVSLFNSSPVAQRAGLSAPDPTRCARLGKVLEDMILSEDPTCPRESLDVRVYQYYLPIYFWASALLEEHKQTSSRPLMLGFSCPQGGGKTTMARFLRRLFAEDSRTCAGASIDDFYLTFKEQTELAARHWQNGLLRYRGNPGTHDVSLMRQTLNRVRLLNQPGAPDFVKVIKYDKTQNGGRGDRGRPEDAELVPNGLDVFLVEGWCLGFTPVDDDTTLVDPNLADVNRYMHDFASCYDQLDAMLVVEVDDLECVYEWRAQPEREAIAAGKPGLSPEQIRDFVDRFMPSYKQYTPRLYGYDNPVFPGKELHIKIDAQRRPVEM